MKQCNICNTEKPIDEFYSKQVTCKPCWKERNKVNAKKGKYYIKQNKKPSAIKAREKWSKKLSGVYAIFDKGVCLYVGKSTRMLHRFADHMSYVRNPFSIEHQRNQLYNQLAKHDYFVFGMLDNDMKQEEHYISLLKPLYNSDHNK